MFEFGYPSNWNLNVDSTSIPNVEDVFISPVISTLAMPAVLSPILSVDYIAANNGMLYICDPADKYSITGPIQIGGYGGNFCATTSTAGSSQESVFSEKIMADVETGSQSGLTLDFVRLSTSSDFSVSDDIAFFKAVAATVRFDTPSTTQNQSPADSRDARRLADLHVVQAALELYYNKCGYYPGAVVTSKSCPSNHAQVTTWKSMTQSLLGTSGFTPSINAIPQDPIAGATYYYGTDAQGSQYVIAAKLEDPTHSGSSYKSHSLAGITATGLTSCALPFYCLTLY